MNTYEPGQQVTITLDPDYAEDSSYMSAPDWVFHGQYESRTDVEDMPHRVSYVNRHGERVARTFFDNEVSPL